MLGFTIPTDAPESDGTLEWDSTTIVIVEARRAARAGSAGRTRRRRPASDRRTTLLAPRRRGSARSTSSPRSGSSCGAQLRNAGRPGIAFCALSAVDIALWDLRARLLDVPLVVAAARRARPRARLRQRRLLLLLARAARRAARRLGRAGHPAREDEARPRARPRPARGSTSRATAIGDAELFVDANGAFSREGGAPLGRALRRRVGRALVRGAGLVGRLRRAAASCASIDRLDIAAGEYAYVAADFRNLIGSVDCLQADVTRCGGITGLLRVNGLAAAHGLDLSGHCAPQLSAHAFCGVDRLRHLEYFHDHVRIESMLFDGVLEPVDGALVPDRSRPGHGLELKRADAERWAA